MGMVDNKAALKALVNEIACLKDKISKLPVNRAGCIQTTVELRREVVKLVESELVVRTNSKTFVLKELNLAAGVYYPWVKAYKEGLYDYGNAVAVSRLPKPVKNRDVTDIAGDIKDTKSKIQKAEEELNSLRKQLDTLKDELLSCI